MRRHFVKQFKTRNLVKKSWDFRKISPKALTHFRYSFLYLLKTWESLFKKRSLKRQNPATQLAFTCIIVNNTNTSKRSEKRRRSGAFIVNFDYISYLNVSWALAWYWLSQNQSWEKLRTLCTTTLALLITEGLNTMTTTHCFKKTNL